MRDRLRKAVCISSLKLLLSAASYRALLCLFTNVRCRLSESLRRITGCRQQTQRRIESFGFLTIAIEIGDRTLCMTGERYRTCSAVDNSVDPVRSNRPSVICRFKHQAGKHGIRLVLSSFEIV